MRMLPGFQRVHRKKGFLAVSSLLLLFATQTFSQSGRRAPKPPQVPTPTPQTDNQSPAKNAAREIKEKVTLLLGRDITAKHLLSEDAIFEHFVKKLSEFANVTATPIGELNREAAVKRAKTETEAIVVLLQFDVDEFQNGTIFLNSPDLEVGIVVFAPKSGQKKFEGQVYYKAVGGPMLKKDNWPSGPPIKITTEAVGIEAAEQVRDWLVIEDVKKRNQPRS